MSESRYGGKCHRCADLLHQGEQSKPPISWLQLRPLECADCMFCQERALLRAIADAGLGVFGPEVREAVKAFRAGTEHPLIDSLRDEIQAIEHEAALIEEGPDE